MLASMLLESFFVPPGLLALVPSLALLELLELLELFESLVALSPAL
jgi:hypothetical protein